MARILKVELRPNPVIQVEGQDLTTQGGPVSIDPIKDLDGWKRGKDFKNLRDLLKKIRIKHADARKYFWTDRLLRQAITRDRLIEEFKSSEYHHSCSLQDFNLLLDHILPNMSDSIEAKSGACNSIERDKFDKPRSRSFFKIFIILVWCEQAGDIGKFIKRNICDEDLPLSECDNPTKVRSWRGELAETQRECFSNWKDLPLETFQRIQHEVIIPYFGPLRDQSDKIRHVDYIKGTILPWIEKDTNKDMAGGYGKVSCVTPHPTSHGFQDLKQVKAARGVFARKTIMKDHLGNFENEAKMLRIFSGRHDHLITLLMTFTLDGCESLLFPWAECDLEIFWKKTPAPYSDTTMKMDPETIEWMSEQIVGIISALHGIHCPPHLNSEEKKFARHGDIKPENIFWFPSNNQSKGMLVIGDFGISSIHGNKSKSNVPNKALPVTPDYRPPECDQEGGVISRAFDIWTLGCLLMEMVCWALGGRSMIEDFDKERSMVSYIGTKTNIWFDLNRLKGGGHAVMVKETVIQWMRKLSDHEGCTEYFQDLLSIIHNHMLVVLSSSANRITSEQLLQKV
ncbi:kinase-like protein [Corynespora cassiicola Philippines]|uniref:Kinase-like protein n=1 Tax=Corynespora cassiicola Philippines TaxID=1448308 RepID=A0A2T2NTR1_CORCC|nr:kinase-like protein [Corynespora cassiicola Philippines]